MDDNDRHQKKKYLLNMAEQCFDEAHEALLHVQALNKLIELAIMDGDDVAIGVFVDWKTRSKARSQDYNYKGSQYIVQYVAVIG